MNMEGLAICRICLNANVSHLIQDTHLKLQEVYEKLTSKPFQSAMKPSLICYICHAHLYKAHKLMLQCLKAEEFLTQMYSQLLGNDDEVQQETVKIDKIFVSPLLCTGVIEHINIEGTSAKVNEEINMAYEVDVKKEIESEEDLAELYIYPAANLDYELTISNLEENYIKEEIESITYKQNVQREENFVWNEGIAIANKSELITPNDNDAVNKTCKGMNSTKNVVTDTNEVIVKIERITDETNKEKSNKQNTNIFMNPNKLLTNNIDKENKIRPWSDSSAFQCKQSTLIYNETNKSKKSKKGLRNVIIKRSVRNITSDYQWGKESYVNNLKCRISQNNDNCQSSVEDCNINVHLKKEIPLICDLDTKDKSKIKLATSKRAHTANKPYICDVCDKRFAQTYTLKCHESLHTGDSPFICKLCNKKFTEKGSLKTHTRLHTGEKPYICKICDKSFARSHHLKTHGLIHTGEKPFSCQICGRTFTQLGHLKTHELSHSEKKRYICKMCNKSFIHMASLKRHESLHDKEKPFICNICNKEFARASDLKIHGRVHTGEKPYSCDICALTFRYKSRVKIHLKKHM